MIRRVAVVGGGISGLAAAFRLMREDAEAEVILFEASDRLGGIIQSDRSQGVILEGGPDSFLRRKPQAIQLAEELGLGGELMSTNPHVRGSYIFHAGHFADIPPGVQAGIPTRLEGLWGTELLSMGEKLRLLGDFSLPRQSIEEDMALGTLLRYRLGDGYVDRIAAPILSGIYAGDIDRLSTAVTAPQLLAFQRRGRSLIQEAQKQAAQMTVSPYGTAPNSVFASLQRGVGSLTEALYEAMRGRVDIRLESPVTMIEGMPGGYRITALNQSRAWDVSHVVVAVPAYQAARMLDGWDGGVRELLAGIAYADLAVVGAVYEPSAFDRTLNKTGFLVPKGEGLGMTAGTWVRAKWDYRDTTDLVPIRAFYGRAGDGGLLAESDEQVLARFRQELGYIMGVTDAPRYARVFRVPAGMPQYHVGHRATADRIRREAERTGIAVIGSYFDGVGVPDCIRHANEAARRIVAGDTSGVVGSRS